MTKRALALMLALSMSVGIVLSGCTDSGSTSSAGGDTASGGGGSSGATDVGSFDDIEFPESLPEKIVMGDGLDYSYDDLTERYSIEIMCTNYGEAALTPENDPVNQWLSEKFNMDILLTSPSGEDYQTVVSTRFSANDYPDILMLPTREYGFTLSDQGLLMDAKNIYPYMLLSNNYTTQSMIQWSTNNSNGEIPFITKYSIQDSNFGIPVRQDWLEALDMEYPTTKEELLDFAKACTFNDPDGNGKDDTYFMTGGGEGKGYGMLTAFENMFGNPAMHVENGEFQHPYFNGTRKEVISFFKELVDAQVLAPDWFTKNWSQACADMANDLVGMGWFPSGAFHVQVVTKDNTEKTMENLEKYKYYKEAPIEGGKFPANGNPGFMWAFLKEKFEGQDGKLKRVAHMIDTMTLGGENFFQTIQSSIPEVYEAAGITVEGERVYGYNDDGKTFYIADVGTQGAPFRADDGYGPTGIWQQFGLVTTYQANYISDEMSEFDKAYNEKANEGNEIILSYDRWPNDGLLVTLSGEAAEAQTTLTEWVLAEEYKFIAGGRSMDEWDSFTQEWLSKGGKEIIKQAAEQLGVEVPDYAK
ncbi:extracellular solute-binding protein [Hydrogeniiclostridium mannosilyticum]|uniref:extracellular solute-binding protein n=1 Tax=Hydrogeniiclostridium mannosilyticum TaxID=2764322 RepID=UPI00399A1177